MATPKGISSQHIKVMNGDAVHIYNDNDFIVLQLRSETPTVESRLGQSRISKFFISLSLHVFVFICTKIQL
ncbi:Uncharacterized protein dnl_45790 [Desulfonema limicola]|uniref:Uncharacterized protein n=1 Tax=Desulfonema limicola TaxID=45656 RepID=A0A975BBB6_9BACT|nr:Uncharacterized protein dnl_45790 [Desulfonema limicola]